LGCVDSSGTISAMACLVVPIFISLIGHESSLTFSATNNMNQVRIADQVFEISEHNLTGFLRIGPDGWRTSWRIEIACNSRDINGMTWSPRVGTHSFHLDLSPSSWPSGSTLDLPDDEDGEPAFMVYVFEHEVLSAASIAATWSGNTLALTLQGATDVFADEIYGAQLAFEARCNLVLAGIVVDEHHFKNAQERLAQHVDPSLFCEPERHSNGGVLFRPHATDAQ
jgi:hypothetical protein